MRQRVADAVDWYAEILRYKLFNRTKKSIRGISATFVAETQSELYRALTLQGEEPVISHLLSHVDEDDVVWDVGANIGTHSVYIGKKADELVSVEPHPPTATRLRRNLELNDISESIVAAALSDEAGIMELSDPSESEAERGTGTFRLGEMADSSWLVGVMTGDQLLERAPQPDVIKIDVEGNELQTLEGMETVLQGARQIICELHPQHVDVAELRETLVDSGFKVDELDVGRDEQFLVATR